MSKFYMTYFIHGLFPNWPFLMTGYVFNRSDTVVQAVGPSPAFATLGHGVATSNLYEVYRCTFPSHLPLLYIAASAAWCCCEAKVRVLLRA